MGTVFKDLSSNLQDSEASQSLKSFTKTQKSFDKAYKHSIRIFIFALFVIYVAITFLAMDMIRSQSMFTVRFFEKYVMMEDNENVSFYFRKGVGFFCILLSSIPLSFTNIVDLLVLMHTSFAEWDVNIVPADINFVQPHATLAFGKVAHLFFSRKAMQRDNKQSIRLFHVGGHFYKNKQLQQILTNQKNRDIDKSFSSDSEISENMGQNDEDFSQILGNDEYSLDYLPGEIKYTPDFVNDEAELILNGPDCQKRREIFEFMRGITLCHQINVIKDMKQSGSDMYQYVGVFNDEIATLDFAAKQNFKLVYRNKKMLQVDLMGKQERYEELGVVTTKAVMGHFMTISATRLAGQQAGILYMKGSIATLKHYFVNREADFQYLNQFEQKFIQSGLHAVVYAKRQLTIEETNKLIITINEGTAATRESTKLDGLLYQLTSIQLEILGVLGV